MSKQQERYKLESWIEWHQTCDIARNAGLAELIECAQPKSRIRCGREELGFRSIDRATKNLRHLLSVKLSERAAGVALKPCELDGARSTTK
jgi:hypothetical protein